MPRGHVLLRSLLLLLLALSLVLMLQHLAVRQGHSSAQAGWGSAWPSVFSRHAAPPVIVKSFEPGCGPHTGQTEVTFTLGTAACTKDTPCTCVCDFGSGKARQRVKASTCKDSQVVCATPQAADQVRAVPLHVSINNGTNWLNDTSGMTFSYVKQPDVTALTPSTGPCHASNKVTFVGSDMNTGCSIRCRFGDRDTPGTPLDSKHLVCHTPSAWKKGLSVPTALSVNAQQWVATAKKYTWYGDPLIDAYSPTSGPYDGKSVVRFTGRDLDLGSGYLCRFTKQKEWRQDGDANASYDVPAKYVADPPHIECTPRAVPDHDLEFDSTRISVSLNGGDHMLDVGNFHQFRIEQFPQPPCGVATGGTPIQISGKNLQFGTQYLCRFNHTIVPGNLTGTAVTCSAPPLAQVLLDAGSVAGDDDVDAVMEAVFATSDTVTVVVHVTANGRDWSAEASTYSYYRQPVVHDVFPMIGPVSGGTEVSWLFTRTWTLPPKCEQYTCAFQTVGRVTAKYWGPDKPLIKCISPEKPPLGVDTGKVGVSLNGVDFSWAQDNFSFYTIASYLPQGGASTGGSPMTLTGAYLLDPSMARSNHTRTTSCLFGDGGSQVSTPAVVVDANTVKCKTAHLPAEHPLGALPLSINVNGLQATKVGVFQYYPEPVLDTWVPHSGPSYGDTRIAVNGRHLSRGTQYQCRFTFRSTALDVAGMWIEQERRIVCLTPKPPAEHAGEGLVQLSLSLNGVDWQFLGLFDYYTPPLITGIDPNIGSVDGGTLVTVSGFNFGGPGSPHAQHKCRFGPLSDNIVPGRYDAERSVIMCTSPPLRDDGYRHVGVSVALNGQDFSRETAGFTYYAESEYLARIAIAILLVVLVVLAITGYRRYRAANSHYSLEPEDIDTYQEWLLANTAGADTAISPGSGGVGGVGGASSGPASATGFGSGSEPRSPPRKHTAYESFSSMIPEIAMITPLLRRTASTYIEGEARRTAPDGVPITQSVVPASGKSDSTGSSTTGSMDAGSGDMYRLSRNVD